MNSLKPQDQITYLLMLPIDGHAYPFLVHMEYIKKETLHVLADPTTPMHIYNRAIGEIDKIKNYTEFLPGTQGKLYNFNIVQTHVMRMFSRK